LDHNKRVVNAVTQALALAADAAAWPSATWWAFPAGAVFTAPPRPAKRKAEAGAAAPAAGYVRLRRNEWPPGKAPKLVALADSEPCVCEAPPSSAAAVAEGAPPPPRLGCGRECLNRRTNTFCDSRTCPCGLACSNRPFHLLPPPPTRAIRTQGRGWGLAAAAPLDAGAFVVEYCGEILDDIACEQRLLADRAAGETNFYMMEVARNVVIDARFKGNVSRLINSSCAPNCATQRWVDGATGETRVGIFTLRAVEAGEELTYDYCFTHFGDEAAASFRCTCGAPACRGTLDANPQRGLNRGRRIEVLWDDGVWYRATVAAFNAGSGKFRLLYDDGDTETVRLEADPAARGPEDVQFRWLPEDSAEALVLSPLPTEPALAGIMEHAGGLGSVDPSANRAEAASPQHAKGEEDASQ